MFLPLCKLQPDQAPDVAVAAGLRRVFSTHHVETRYIGVPEGVLPGLGYDLDIIGTDLRLPPRVRVTFAQPGAAAVARYQSRLNVYGHDGSYLFGLGVWPDLGVDIADTPEALNALKDERSRLFGRLYAMADTYPRLYGASQVRLNREVFGGASPARRVAELDDALGFRWRITTAADKARLLAGESIPEWLVGRLFRDRVIAARIVADRLTRRPAYLALLPVPVEVVLHWGEKAATDLVARNLLAELARGMFQADIPPPAEGISSSTQDASVLDEWLAAAGDVLDEWVRDTAPAYFSLRSPEQEIGRAAELIMTGDPIETLVARVHAVLVPEIPGLYPRGPGRRLGSSHGEIVAQYGTEDGRTIVAVVGYEEMFTAGVVGTSVPVSTPSEPQQRRLAVPS